MELFVGFIIFCLIFGWKYMKRLRNLFPQNTERIQKKVIAQQAAAHESIDDIFEGFIGNEGAVYLLKRELRFARQSLENKLPAFGLFGPPSTGKTELARRITKALGLPMLTLSKSTLSKEENFFNEVSKEIEDVSDGMLVAPPMVIFIDEAHVLPGRIQDSLLTALESDDRCFRSALGDINTHNITFIIATTDPGKFRSAFRSRLFEINLESYTIEQIVEILKWRRKNDKDINAFSLFIPDEALAYIAKAARATPRRAIDLLKVVAKAIFLGDVEPTLEDIQGDMWRTLSCDRNGLVGIDRKYLRFLADRETAGLSLLVAALGMDKDNITNVIEPWLVQNELIERSRAGRSITIKGYLLVHPQGRK